MISSLRALLQGNLQESWDEYNNGRRLMCLTPRTLDPGAGALSQEFHGFKSWWLHGAALGAPEWQSATSFRAESTQWLHWGVHLTLSPLLGAFSSCLCDVGVGDGPWRAGDALSHRTRWQSQTLPQLTLSLPPVWACFVDQILARKRC